MLLDVGTYRGLERLHVVVRDLVHQPSELVFLGRDGLWPVRLGEDRGHRRGGDVARGFEVLGVGRTCCRAEILRLAQSLGL